MRRPRPDRATTVAQLLRQWPATAAVFVRRGMACPGCAMAPFETIADAAGAYGLAPARLLAEVRRTALGDRRAARSAHQPEKGGTP